MHARRPFASSAEEEEANRAAASAAEVALDEEEQDRLVDELKREAAVAIGWTQAGLAAVMLALTLLYVCTTSAKLALSCLVFCSLVVSGVSTLPTARPARLTFNLALGSAILGGLIPSLYAIATGTFAASRLFGPDIGFGLALAGRWWIDGLERDLRALEKGKYKLKGA